MRVIPRAACALLLLIPAIAAAQAYPERPIRIVVPFSAGGSADVFARAIGNKMSEAWGQQVVIDNRAGSGGVIGTEIAAAAPRDGYTLMMGNTANMAINPALYRKLPFDVVRDFAPITLVAAAPYVMVVPTSLGVSNTREFLALARAKPGQMNYASLGNGSASHLTGELLQSMAGIKLVHVPYKTLGTVLTDLISGQVQLFFLGMVSAQSQIKGGRMRAIGVTGPKRSPAVPDLPTVAESGVPGYDVVAWYGLFAPTGTPRPIVLKVNAEVKRIVELPDLRDRLSAEGAEVTASTPEQFAAYLKTEMVKWARVVQASGARTE
ncbi:MAG: Bug family tripartite tricarboxylate transporter substrate binding protein [Burkholderiales bacterium]